MTKVSELMTCGVRSLSPRDSAETAALAMDTLNVTSMPVCEDGRLVGLITDRDIAVRGVARGLPPSSTPLGQLMSTHLVWCYEDESVDEVMAGIGRLQVRRLPVVDRSRQLVGMLAIGETRGDGSSPRLPPGSDGPPRG